jgi:hypothetical protein
MEPSQPSQKPKSRLVLIILVVIIVILAGLLAWCWFYRHPTTPAPSGSGAHDAPATASGPCTDGAANPTPSGFSVFENAELGFHFAYPSSWGSVTTATAPMGGVSGHYLLGSFSANPNVSFGGNATDYTVSARGGMPTDSPGYLIATDKYYTVQLWKLHESGVDPDQAKYALYPITEETTQKNGCNAKALVSQYPLTEFFGYSYDVARFNLQSSNAYYGVNFVLKNPDAASRTDLDKLITSFQLLP